jgi:hypothetical protein
LAYDETANYVDAERAAKLRARTRSEGQRKSAEESSQRGHQDGTKTEHAGFEDGVLSVHATLTLFNPMRQSSDDSSYVNAIELLVDGGMTGLPMGSPRTRG